MSQTDTDLVRTLRAAMKPRGTVSCWPEFGDPDDDWVVGVALKRGGKPYRVTERHLQDDDLPGYYQRLAVVRTRGEAEALAAVLNGARP